MAQKLLRGEEAAEDGTEGNSLSPGDLLGGVASGEMIVERAAIMRWDPPHRLFQPPPVGGLLKTVGNGIALCEGHGAGHALQRDASICFPIVPGLIRGDGMEPCGEKPLILPAAVVPTVCAAPPSVIEASRLLFGANP